MMQKQIDTKERYPSVTTISGMLDKPFLVKWANNLGKKNIDVTEYVANQAKKGTLIHTIVESHVTKEGIYLDKYTEEEISNASNIFYNNYMNWENKHTFEFIFSEKYLVSNNYRFGGKVDIYCILDGKYTVIDLKTSKSVNEEQILQVSAYKPLLEENNYKVDQILILNLKKEIGEAEIRFISEEEQYNYFEIFKHLLSIYFIKKEIGWK